MPQSSNSSQDDVQKTSKSTLFSIPAPVKALFDSFPFKTYPPNELPRRSPRPTSQPTLYVFSTPHDADAGRPSFNPLCLKWQTFLKIAQVPHKLSPSTNHASPTGTLPFLLPSIGVTSSTPPRPIPVNKLVKFALDQGATTKEPRSSRLEAYQSLLDFRIRNAWLYNLYLDPSNAALATALYISPSSSSPLVQASISYQLRSAAEAELLKHSATIDRETIYREAARAFEALSLVLGEEQWFFASDGPTIFDASMFAYTHLLLDEGIGGVGWKGGMLVSAVKEFGNLVRHRDRILADFYES